MYQITIPEWANTVYLNISTTFSKPVYEAIQQQRSTLLTIIENEVSYYIHQCQLQSRTFPDIQKLTGEYYITAENYRLYSPSCKNPNHQHQKTHEEMFVFSIEVSCLEKQWYPTQQNQDYLGLELHFAWHPETQTFHFTGDIDSSSI